MYLTMFLLSLPKMLIDLDWPYPNYGKHFILHSKYIPECSSKMTNKFCSKSSNMGKHYENNCFSFV